MIEQPLFLVHGYGVRRSFWSALTEELSQDTTTVYAEDVDLPTIAERVEAVTRRAREIAAEHGPAVLIGHSLGGVLVALAARDLPADVVSHVVVIAAPFGDRVGRAFGPLFRLRLAVGLVGKREIHNRFFGPTVPAETRDWLHARTAGESAEIRALSRQRSWFHTTQFPNGIQHPALMIASEQDRIIDVMETEQFADAVGAEMVRFRRSEQIGHNDFGVYPPAARKTAAVIRAFIAAHPR